MTLAPKTKSMVFIDVNCNDKKENEIFLIYKEIQKGSGAKSYMRKGFQYLRKGANI
jgi:hypothetical protein